MKFVEWDEKYSVHIKIIDSQHKKLLDFTNELFDACIEGKKEADKSFQKTIKEAVEYVKIHFKTEENLMITNKYPDFPAHKKKHEEFILQIISEVKKYQSGLQFVPNNFVRYLRDWLLEHIAIVDKKLQYFFADMDI